MNLMINEAFKAAKKAHGSQTRKYDNESYMFHLNEVFSLLTYADVKDVEILVVGLLHDTLEDTSLTKAEIERQFGGLVLSMIECLTENKNVTKQERKDAAVEKAKVLNVACLNVKLADLMSNLSAVPPDWSDEKKRTYFDHCSKILAAIKQNTNVKSASQKLLELCEFFLEAQTKGVTEYNELCRLAERGQLSWCDEKEYFVIVEKLESNDNPPILVEDLNNAYRLDNELFTDAMRLNLLRSLQLKKGETKRIRITSEITLCSPDPSIFAKALELKCWPVILTP